ncbi:hypothetical protein L484_012337 [Morus notabilis]|uniref:Uncharacterized protein n=1 Tax=Morus notabilis TaxID=981085 RepID=W9S3D5_9ROSA|nr:uncharacterized protein LOC21395558 [Morus notabilis]EXC12523.1 hypothetical protein L484_012337 [Morus notabilis]
MWSMSTPVGPIPSNPTVAFTTPPNYAGRLSHLLAANGLNPLSSPTLLVEPTPRTISALKSYLPPPHSLNALFSAVASDLECPLLSPFGDREFTIAALGKDSELLYDEYLTKFGKNRDRIRVLVPLVAMPSGLVRSLRDGRRQRVLCTVPIIVDLEEPPVVPNFLRELESSRWIPVLVGTYETP